MVNGSPILQRQQVQIDVQGDAVIMVVNGRAALGIPPDAARKIAKTLMRAADAASQHAALIRRVSA